VSFSGRGRDLVSWVKKKEKKRKRKEKGEGNEKKKRDGEWEKIF